MTLPELRKLVDNHWQRGEFKLLRWTWFAPNLVLAWVRAFRMTQSASASVPIRSSKGIFMSIAAE